MPEQPRPPSRRFLDPAAIPLIAGGLVLVLAAAWLWVTPRPEAPAHPHAETIAALQQRIAALEARRPADPAPLAARIAALEARPVPDLSGIERRLAALPAPADLRPVEGRLEGLTGRVAAAEARAAEALARPLPDPAGFAPRAATESLATRADRLSERLDAVAARLQAADAEAVRRNEELARTIAERFTTAERAEAERIAAAGTALEGRLRGAESALATRITALEQAQARITALEARATRLAAFDAIRLRLESGETLGPALAALPQAPPALTRYATLAPPTEAALRLSFEAAARAARAASEPAREGQGVVDSALARLPGLVTVRRGEEIVWGDAAVAEIERARRALEAGDLDGAVARLDRLPPAAREAMRAWVEQARALAAARAALATLTAG